MAIHHVDKDSMDRSSPTPNTHDTTGDTTRMAHQTLSTAYNTQGTLPSTRIVMKNNMILTYDTNGKVSSVYGYVSGASTIPVLIIANQGYDVFTDVLGISGPS